MGDGNGVGGGLAFTCRKKNGKCMRIPGHVKDLHELLNSASTEKHLPQWQDGTAEEYAYSIEFLFFPRSSRTTWRARGSAWSVTSTWTRLSAPRAAADLARNSQVTINHGVLHQYELENWCMQAAP